MPAPLIAITTYPADEESAGRVNLPAEYVDCVRRAGGRALLVPPGERDPSGLLDIVDGLVLTGGGDIDPARWRGGSHPTVYMTDDARDELELELARRAVEHEVPTFAICRGVQVLNVALGGTLHLHVPDAFGESVEHRLPPREPVPHAVSVTADSQLSSVLGAVEIEPMSWHHQSIDRLGRGLRLAAVAPDGVVEAVEHDSHPCLIAVQWHPELTAATDRSQAALFDAFVRAASSKTLVP